MAESRQTHENWANQAPATPQVPPVDVYAQADGLQILVDLPGVTADRLAVEVQDQALRLAATLDLEMPPDLEPIGAEVQSATYERHFELDPGWDEQKTEVRLEDGQARIWIPRRAHLKARRIPVTAG